MRVLVLATSPFPAGRGSQLLIERTTRGLLERGHQVTVLAPRRRETGRPDPFPVERAGWAWRPGDVGSRPELRRALDDALLGIAAVRHRPDVIAGHNLDGGLLAALAGRWLRRPSLYVRHSDVAEELAHYGPLPELSRGVGSALDAMTQRLATRTVALGAEARSCDRFDTLPPPLDPEERRVEPGDGLTLYYEGNRDRYQNPAWLWAALEAARRRSPGVKLLLADGPAGRPARADLALLPRSLPGGFPMKLLGYWVSGIPAVCVASGAPGVRDGREAFVVPGRGSPEAFATRVAEALADPVARRGLAERARRSALARHAPERVAALLEASIERARDAFFGRREAGRVREAGL